MSGLEGYGFSILNPWHRPWTWYTDMDNEEIEIPESAFCMIRQDDTVTKILVPKSRFPQIFEAIILLGEALFTGSRVSRYMAVYQAYECIVVERELCFSAIRHSLSHASSILSRKSTIEELNRIFGSTQINFDVYRHLREFNVHLGKLLIATDTALFKKLIPLDYEIIQSSSIRIENLDAA
jgi:hypothetical protein